MSEPLPETLRRAAAQMRADANTYQPGSQDERLRLTTAALFEAIADDMGDDEIAERGAAGVGVPVLGCLFSPRKPWTAALAAARTYLGET